MVGLPEDSDYLLGLTDVYLRYLLRNPQTESSVSGCVRKIMSEISKNACHCRFNVAELLQKSGYAEDYIRYHFKRVTGKTPVAFLAELRIRHACFLIDIYQVCLL